MSAGAFEIMAVIGYGAAGLSVLAAGVWFFVMDIPSVLGELSGRTAAREVQRIRERNRSVVSPQRPLERTDRIEETTLLRSGAMPSERQGIRAEAMLPERPGLREETVLLSPGSGEDFIVLQDEVFIHTDEVIV